MIYIYRYIYTDILVTRYHNFICCFISSLYMTYNTYIYTYVFTFTLLVYIYIYIYIYTYIHIYIYRQIDRYIDRYIGTQIDRYTDIQIDILETFLSYPFVTVSSFTSFQLFYVYRCLSRNYSLQDIRPINKIT